MYSESYNLKKVLIQPPLEVQPVTMAIFMNSNEPYNPRKANDQAKKFIDILNSHGIEVITIKQALLKGTMDSCGEVLDGKELKQLQKLAIDSIQIEDERRWPLIEQSISQMHPEDLVNIIFSRPTLKLFADDEVSKISPDSFYEEYQISPLFGLMFPRDHFIITNKGFIIGNFRRKDRRKETEVIESALRNIGIQPVFKCKSSDYLEGGDFASTNTISFIANGLRTNSSTIEKMLQKNLFGTQYVVELVDSIKNPKEFHLDHYFNILDEGHVVISEERLYSPCHIYKFLNGYYNKIKSNVSFNEVSDLLNFKYLVANKSEVKNFCLNYLNIGNRKILCNSSSMDSFSKKLLDQGYSLQYVPFNEIHKQYGSLHCCTQALLREKEEEAAV